MALKTNRYTTLTTTLSAAGTSATLTSAAFDNGTQVPLILDYDNTSKIEVILADISGTSLTNIVRGQDGTSAVEHTGTPKICQGPTPSATGYYVKNDLGGLRLSTRQDNATNNNVSKQLAVSGWGFITGTGDGSVTKSITFPAAFEDIPVLLVSTSGYKTGSDPSHIGDIDGAAGERIHASGISTTGFTATCFDTPVNGNRFLFSWIAIGTKS